jgi:hypothetical protein
MNAMIIFVFLFAFIAAFSTVEAGRVSDESVASQVHETERKENIEYHMLTLEDVRSQNPETEVEELIKLTAEEIINNNLGNDTFEVNGSVLTRYDLPTVYYPDVDFDSFQAWMDYSKITDKTSSAYAIAWSSNAYTDEYGLRRYVTTDDQLKINGEDDYTIALGTFYKERGTCGSRWLIVTSTGMYTAITGDEKADRDCDAMHMFTEINGRCLGMIEWLVDTPVLDPSMRLSGTITKGPIEALQGNILYIYRID